MRDRQNHVVVFLYTELAGYIRACLELLAKSGIDVHVFAYPVNVEAPFRFERHEVWCHYYQREKYTDAALLKKINELSPQLIVCSGWIDHGYLKVCKSFFPTIKTVLALDNQLPDSLRGWLSLLRSKYFYKPVFRFAWVPGDPQVAYARKLGFDADAIYTGFYSADVRKFEGMYNLKSGEPFPKRFVFVGRYVDFKGIEDLWEAFDLVDFPGWELWCAGHGPLFENRKTGNGIHHLGFVQPDEMDTFVAQGGVFVLPSRKEPWGVVVHEFAAAGYPIICSNKVGAATAFLKEGINGYFTDARHSKHLKSVMKKMASQNDEKLIDMAIESKRLAGKVTPEKWVATLATMLETT